MPSHAPHFEPMMASWVAPVFWMGIAATCLLLAYIVYAELALRRAVREQARQGTWACVNANQTLRKSVSRYEEAWT